MIDRNEVIERVGIEYASYIPHKEKFYNEKIKILRNGDIKIDKYFNYIGTNIDNDDIPDTSIPYRKHIVRQILDYNYKKRQIDEAFSNYMKETQAIIYNTLLFVASKYQFFIKRKDSLIRTKNNLIDMILNNYDIWRSFITLTFDPKIFGDLSRDKAMYELKKYFIKVKRVFPDFTAIRVDEFQSNGRTHFHLLTNIELGSDLLPERKQLRLWNKKMKKYKEIKHYDLPYWNCGYSSAFDVNSLDDNFNVALYMAKYLTKDIDIRYFGKRKFGVVNRKALKMPKVYKGSSESEKIKAATEYLNKVTALDSFIYISDDPYQLSKIIYSGKLSLEQLDELYQLMS